MTPERRGHVRKACDRPECRLQAPFGVHRRGWGRGVHAAAALS